jgi:phage terminase large subunit-like protein
MFKMSFLISMVWNFLHYSATIIIYRFLHENIHYFNRKHHPVHQERNVQIKKSRPNLDFTKFGRLVIVDWLLEKSRSVLPI